MSMMRLAAVVVVGGILALEGPLLGAEERHAGAEGQPVAVKTMVRARNPEPAPQAEPPAPFVPIVDGRLVAYYRRYPPSYSRQLLESYGYYAPFGAYLYGPRYGYNPQLFDPHDYPLERSSRVLIVVEPTDAPGSLYYYYDSFPPYYGQPGYFPGYAQGGQSVTIVSPTVPQTEPEAGQEAPAQQVRVPGELEKAAFLSTLGPMLGGGERVSVDFAVGELKLHRGDYDGAAEALRRAVAAAPDDPTPKVALGLALTGTGDYEGAAQILKRGLRGMPDWRGLKLLPGQAFGSAAAYQQLLAGIQKAEKADKADKDAQFLLGFQYLATGRYAEAVSHLAQAGLEDPLVLGLMLEAQRRADAEKEGTAAGGQEPAS